MSDVSKKKISLFLLTALFAVCIFCAFPNRAHALTQEEAAQITKKGWQTLTSGKQVYMINVSTPATGFSRINKNWYHFDENGYLSLGWFEDGGFRYFAQRTGKKAGQLKAGYVKIDGQYYLFGEKNKKGEFGKMTVGWGTVDDQVFYFNENGSKLTGLQTIGKNLYYLSPKGSVMNKGRVMTGWQTIEEKRYYFRENGKAGALYGAAYVDKKVKINGIEYTFGKDGVVSNTGSSSIPSDIMTFINEIGEMAHADMLKTGILASITIAQACVESGYGKSVLAVKANNLFGIKSGLSNVSSWESPWKGKSYKINTQEYINGNYVTIQAKFRKYPNRAVSIADHSAYLVGSKLSDGTPRYKGIVGCRNYKKAARIIKKGGYATAPNYVSALCAVIEKYDLTRFD